MAKPPRIEQRFYYAASQKRVYAALTEPRQLVKWFLQEASLEPKTGGAFRFVWRGGYSMKGKVLRARPGKEVEFSWVDRFDGKVLKTVASFTLRKKGSGTLLAVTHSGFKGGRRWVALFGAVQSGWAYYLTNLRSVLEHGVDLRSELDALA